MKIAKITRRALLFLFFVSAFLPCACGYAGQARIVTDVYGRKVEVPAEIRSIICTGSGALRLVVYAQADDMLVGVEDIDKAPLIRRAYNYARNDLLKTLPSIGKGGGRSYTAYEEEIIGLEPDVIFSANSPSALEELARKTGIPVVAVSYGQDIFGDPDLRASLELIGGLLNRSKRCEEILSLIETAANDLEERTGDIPAEGKPAVYTGALTFSGARGFGGTAANFPPFTVIGAANVADRTNEKQAFIVDLEMVLEWDPDCIFLDPGNMDLVSEEYRKNPGYFQSLRAVREGRVYSMISYNNYSPNIEIAIANAYYAGKVLYPDRFADIDMTEKTDALLEAFLGQRFYADMSAAGLSFGELTIGE